MPGPPPKPVEQRIREGTHRADRYPEPIVVAGRPVPAELAKPPDHLPPDAREFWSDTISKLAEVGIVDFIDVPAFEMLATQYARVCEARRVVAEDGLFVLGTVGQKREHPALKIERDATRAFLRLADHFALTPVARTRLGLAGLQAKTMAAEMDDTLGKPKLTPA